MIENYLLEYLVSFSKNKTISKTAKEYHVAPATISRGLQKLEKQINVALFDHQPQKLRLTPAGKYAVKMAEQILNEQKNFIPSIQNFAQKEITVGATIPGPLFLLKEKLSNDNYLFNYELIKDKDCQTQLLRHQVDIVFSTKKINTEEIKSSWVGNEQLFIKITQYNPLFNHKSVSFSDLNGHEFIVFNKIGIWKEIIQTKIPNALFLFQDNMNALNELITKSNFPIFQTNLSLQLSAYKRLQDDKRKLITITDPAAKQPIYAIYRKNDAEKMIDLIKTANILFD